MRKRRAFLKAILDIASGRLIFIDETGVNLSMSPFLARAPIGQRAYCKRPAHHGGNVTIVGALAADGMLAYQAVRGAMNTERFEAFVIEKLVPKLGARDVVFMDNVAFHKVDSVRNAIEKTGARLVFLPPYSPELNPIEEVWSFFKNRMRRAAARDVPDLIDALVTSMRAVTAEVAGAFIKHAGFAHLS